MAEKILIIDDDVDTVKLVGLMLQKQGYLVLSATNGPRGLEQADKEKPDLVLLDIMMPDMDGYEVTRRMRKDPQTNSIPILMFTAKTQLEDKVHGFELGADDYLTKPTHPSELTAHVKALLARTAKNRMPAAAEAKTEKPCFVVGVVSPRGGEGVSTLAANLGDALRMATHMEVIVAEMRPGMGTLGLDLGDADPKAMTELLSCKVEDVTREQVKGGLFVHPTGLRFLLASPHPRDARLMDSVGQMEAVVKHLRTLVPYLVLDLGAGLSSAAQALVKLCDLIYVVAEPQGSAAMHAKMLLEELPPLGVSKQFVQCVVVNRVRSDTQITMSQMEDLLGEVPVVAITPAPELMYMTAKNKTTVMAARPESLTAQQFSKLAASTLELEKLK